MRYLGFPALTHRGLKASLLARSPGCICDRWKEMVVAMSPPLNVGLRFIQPWLDLAWADMQGLDVEERIIQHQKIWQSLAENINSRHGG